MRAFYTHLLFVHPLRQKKSSHPNRFSPRAARGDPLRAPWVLIPQCSSEVHLQIAKDFVASLPDESSRAALEATFTQTDLWWKSYFAVLQQLGLTERWDQYRRPRIIRELESSLEQHGVPLAGLRA